jgi:tRNA(fMet)-specific endonuclease VapC
MIILDTDHLSLLDRDNLTGLALGERLSEVVGEPVFVTIITYEEQTRGWLTYVAKANTPEKQVEAYRRLHRHIETFQAIPILDYDEHCARRFESLRRAGVRIGSMDLKIAAVAMVNDALLFSRNLVDFNKVAGLRVEDWST